jgi:hypothetical protein
VLDMFCILLNVAALGRSGLLVSVFLNAMHGWMIPNSR